MRILQPPDWPRPRGYANGVEARGRIVFIAGQVGWDKDQRFRALDFAGQFEQALDNILTVLRQAGGGPEHIARMTWYVTDKHAYLADIGRIGQFYRKVMGRNYPAMSVIQVSALIENAALVEIEATAVLPD